MSPSASAAIPVMPTPAATGTAAGNTEALGRQVLFSAIILAIEIPLGIYVALNMPRRGFWSSLVLVLMALPLLIPFNVVGTIWQIFGRVDIGQHRHRDRVSRMQVDYCARLRPAVVQSGVKRDLLGGRVAVDQPAVGVQARQSGGIEKAERRVGRGA